MNRTISTPDGCYRRHHEYDLADNIAVELVEKGLAEKAPPTVADIMDEGFSRTDAEVLHERMTAKPSPVKFVEPKVKRVRKAKPKTDPKGV